jgi:Cu+-exporting ATPase
MANKVVLLVEGMMCQKNCGATVAGALRGVPGVMEVDVSFAKSAAYVLVDVEKVSSLGHFVSLCVGAVEAVGFDCDRLQNQAPALVLEVLGMMCNNSCTPTVYNAIMSASPERIVHAEVSLDEQEAKVWGPIGESDEEVSAKGIVDAIEASGFDVNVKQGVGSISAPSSSNKEVAARNMVPSKPSTVEDGSDQKWSVDDSNANFICAELSIVGMSCASCVRSVETGLLDMEGVQSVRIALLLEKGEVLFDPVYLKSGADALKKKVEALGYRANVLTSRRHGDVPRRCVAYRVLGMSTAACAARIEEALNACRGVDKAKVDVAREILFVHLDDGNVPEEGKGSEAMVGEGLEYPVTPGLCRGARDVVGLVRLAGYPCSFLREVADGALDSSSGGLWWRR